MLVNDDDYNRWWYICYVRWYVMNVCYIYVCYFVCMCVCMCDVCMYVYTYVYMYVCMYACMYVNVCIYV